jgi:hypothetical protein
MAKEKDIASPSKTKEKQKSQTVKQKTEESKNGVVYFAWYFAATVVLLAYSGFLYDSAGFRSHAQKFVVLQPFEVLFDAVEKYSPFHQVIKSLLRGRH